LYCISVPAEAVTTIGVAGGKQWVHLLPQLISKI